MLDTILFRIFCLPVSSLRTILKYTELILPVLYGHETWSLTLKEEHRFRMFENRVLRIIFEPKREEVPVSIAEQSKACTVYNHLNIEITGSNPAWGMDVCLHVCVLCCPLFW
jgi:hypothetical protein